MKTPEEYANELIEVHGQIIYPETYELPMRFVINRALIDVQNSINAFDGLELFQVEHKIKFLKEVLTILKTK